MKKLAHILVIFFFAGSVSFADDFDNDSRFRIKDRTLEFGINLNAGFYNNIFSVQDFQKEKLTIDLSNYPEGFIFNSGFGFSPLYFNFNKDNIWGFGLSLNIESFGHIGLSENLITFNEIINDKSNGGFSVFTDASLNVFFNLFKFKVNIKPALFYTAAYAKPKIIYSYDASTPSININYDIQLYTAFKVNDINEFDIDFDSFAASPGVDLSLELVYPLSRELGLYKKFYLFDIDVGLDLQNIPIKPSSLKYYTHMFGNLVMEGKTADEFINSIEEEFFKKPDPDGEKELSILRPFRTTLFINWRPMESRVFLIVPKIGFSVNPLYQKPFFMEYGLDAKIDLANLFILSLGVNHLDRIWKSNIGVALNLRAIEINAGVDFRSNEFKEIFNPGGFGINAGIKFGW